MILNRETEFTHWLLLIAIKTIKSVIYVAIVGRCTLKTDEHYSVYFLRFVPGLFHFFVISLLFYVLGSCCIHMENMPIVALSCYTILLWLPLLSNLDNSWIVHLLFCSTFQADICHFISGTAQIKMGHTTHNNLHTHQYK